MTKEIKQKAGKIEPVHYLIYEKYKKSITSFILIESRIPISPVPDLSFIYPPAPI